MISERDDADRHVALGVLGLLGLGRDRVEADVGEEDRRGPGKHPASWPLCILAPNRVAEEAEPAVPVRANGFQFVGIDVERPTTITKNDDRQLDDHHDGIEVCALLDPDHQNGW